MTRRVVKNKGFTLIELLIVCAVIAILAAITVVVYQGLQKRAANAAVFKDLKSASEQLGLSYIQSPSNFSSLDELSDDIQSSRDVIIRLVVGYSGNVYENLTPVQEGVLFYEVCEELIADPDYSTIHAREGGGTNSVVMRCTDDIGGNHLQITGWQSIKWFTPVTKANIQEYINDVPYDSWWIDRQDVVRGFYTQMIQRFEAKGGTFPVTSFWDTWANQWSGVPKEELPAPSPPPASTAGAYCVEAYYARFPDDIYKITQDDKIEARTC